MVIPKVAEDSEEPEIAYIRRKQMSHPGTKRSLFGPLGFLYVASYCVLVIAMGWKGWWPGFLGCIVMASWPVLWAIGGTLLHMIRSRRTISPTRNDTI